jgi:hemerythrin-like domain-containing protein
MLRIVDRVSERLESGQSVDTEHMDEIVEFIRVFADKCHHGQEENILFKEMEAAWFPRDKGPSCNLMLCRV